MIAALSIWFHVYGVGYSDYTLKMYSQNAITTAALDAHLALGAGDQSKPERSRKTPMTKAHSTRINHSSPGGALHSVWVSTLHCNSALVISKDFDSVLLCTGSAELIS